MQPEPIPPPRDLVDRFRRALERQPPAGGTEAVADQAAALFAEAFGTAASRAGAAAAYTPLAAEHTHYFDGFGLLIRQPGGVAAAAAPAATTPRLVTAGVETAPLAALHEALAARLAPAVGEVAALDLAVVSTAGYASGESVMAAAAMALARAHGVGDDARLPALAAAAVQEVLGRPHGPAYVLAARTAGPLALIDAETLESIALDRPESAGFGMVLLGEQPLPEAAALWERRALVERSLGQLRRVGYSGLTSLRKLEHFELPSALQHIDAAAKPLIRHLVTEDRRVPRMVAALRREDGQLLGALLMMSQASRRDDLLATSKLVSFVTDEAEVAEGMYGARAAGPGAGDRVVVVGRPFLLPPFLDRLAEEARRQSGRAIETAII